MIKRIREFIACKYPVQPLGTGFYKNFNVRKCWLAAFMIVLGIVQGCATVPANIAAPIPPENVVGHSSLAAGRKIYVSLLKCAMCHRPKPVSDYSAETWAKDILPKMSKKARLTPQEYADVLDYVTTTTNATLPKSESNK